MTETDPDSAARPLPLIARVFAAMADGEFHSGETLAATLGVSRSAVWKAVEALRALGATLHAVPNRGYRLVAAAEPLDASRIRAELSADAAARVRALEVAWSLCSTNTELLDRPDPPAGECEVLLAEYQSAGRGRRGRSWLAPPGGSLCLSLSWTFPEVPRDLGSLGLVIGLAVLRALKREGLTAAQLKWPNDVLVNGRKLAGCLIELRAEGDGPACVVIGVGLNVALGEAVLAQLEQAGAAPVDLAGCGLECPSRNRLAARIIEASLAALMKFGEIGLKGFVEEWRAADVLRGRMVDVNAPDGLCRGLARGIDVHGALMVETPQGLRRFISGDVTVRPA